MGKRLDSFAGCRKAAAQIAPLMLQLRLLLACCSSGCCCQSWSSATVQPGDTVYEHVSQAQNPQQRESSPYRALVHWSAGPHLWVMWGLCKTDRWHTQAQPELNNCRHTSKVRLRPITHTQRNHMQRRQDDIPAVTSEATFRNITQSSLSAWLLHNIHGDAFTLHPDTRHESVACIHKHGSYSYAYIFCPLRQFLYCFAICCHINPQHCCGLILQY